MLLAINPIALDLGFLEIRWYGVLIGLGVIFGMLIAFREGERVGIKSDDIVDVLLWAIPSAVICSRLYYVIFEWATYVENPIDIFKITEGGLSIHGALIGAITAAFFVTKKKKMPFWRLLDVAAPSIMLGQVLGRWGNFINQEAFGRAVSRPFLERIMMPDWLINQMYIDGEYHHPTFLYESLWNLLGMELIFFFRKTNPRVGETFFLYVIWYSVGRIFVESLRTDSLMLFGVLRQAQVLSVVLIVGSVILLNLRRKQGVGHYMDKEGVTSK